MAKTFDKFLAFFLTTELKIHVRRPLCNNEGLIMNTNNYKCNEYIWYKLCDAHIWYK